MSDQHFTELHDYLNAAFEHFNQVLFDSTLPPVVITLSRKNRIRGFFVDHSFYNKNSIDLTSATLTPEQISENFAHEISLNPESFNRPNMASLSTLVHEQCHLYQHCYGTVGRPGYHNREWADIMIDRGLIPTSTGVVGGRQTGYRVTHVVEEGGRYQSAYEHFAVKTAALSWAAVPISASDPADNNKKDSDQSVSKSASLSTKKAASKTKYQCIDCGVNAWAKPDTLLICGICMNPMLIA